MLVSYYFQHTVCLSVIITHGWVWECAVCARHFDKFTKKHLMETLSSFSVQVCPSVLHDCDWRNDKSPWMHSIGSHLQERCIVSKRSIWSSTAVVPKVCAAALRIGLLFPFFLALYLPSPHHKTNYIFIRFLYIKVWEVMLQLRLVTTVHCYWLS